MASEATKEPHWGALRGLCAPQEGGPCGSCWRCADASPALGRWKPWFSPGSSNLRARETYVNAVCFNILFLLCPVPTGRINYFERKQIFWLRCIAGRAACTKCGRARNTQGAMERGPGEVKDQSLAEQRREERWACTSPRSQQVGSQACWGVRCSGAPSARRWKRCPPGPGSSTAFHSLVLKLSCWKLPFSTGTRFKDNRAVCFNSSQWYFY